MATANNRVEVDLIANDRLTPTLNRIRGMADGLKGSFSGIKEGLLQGIGQGAVSAAIDGITASVRTMNAAIVDGAKLQVDVISTAGSVATQMGMSFQSANKMVEEMSVNFEKMAASLPGDANLYGAIGRGVMPVISQAAGGDTQYLKEKTEELTRYGGILANKAGVTGTEAASTLQRLAAGSLGMGELRQLDFGQKNFEFVQNLQKLSAGRELKEMGTKERINLIAEAQKRSINSGAMGAMNATLDTQLSTLQSKFTADFTGIFGTMRRIADKGGRNIQESATAAIMSFTSMFDAVESMLSKAGFNFDPASAIIGVMDFASDLLNQISLIVSGGKALNFGEISEKLQSMLGGFLDGAIANLDKLPFDKIGMMIGGLIGAIVGAVIVNIPKLIHLSLAVLSAQIRTLLGLLILAPIKVAWDVAERTVMGAVNMIKRPIQAVFDAVGRFFEWIKSLVNKPREVVDQVASGAGKVAGGALDWLNKPLPFIGGQYGVTQPSILGGVKPTAPLTVPQNAPSQDGGKPQNVSFQPILNFNGTTADPRALADQVAIRLNEVYSQFKQGALA